MRFVALSLIALLSATSAAAQPNPNFLKFDQEPVGQAFSEPPLRFIVNQHFDEKAAMQQFTEARAKCAGWVKDIYQDRRTIFLTCLRSRTDAIGVVVEMDNPAQVAKYSVR